MNGKNNNIGCLVFFLLYMTGSLIYVIKKGSASDFASIGYLVLACIGLVIMYVIFKALIHIKDNTELDTHDKDSTDSTDKKGCLKWSIIIIVLFLLFEMYFSAIENFEMNRVVGLVVHVMFIVVLSVIIGIRIYKG